VSGQPEQVAGPDTVSSAGDEHGPTFWILLVVGWVAIAIGLFGVFDHPRQASAFNVFRLLIGLNIVNDAIAIPVLLLVAWAVRRWVPAWGLVPVQVWLIVGGIVTLYAYPLVGSYGKARANASQLPFNYAHNLLIVLGCITVACGLLAFRSWRKERTRRAPLEECV
jgi:fatty acid desaturase